MLVPNTREAHTKMARFYAIPIPNKTMLTTKSPKHCLADRHQAVNKIHNTVHKCLLYFEQRFEPHNKGKLYMIMHP